MSKTLTLSPRSKNTWNVLCEGQSIGTIKHFFVRHIGVHAWEATTNTGRHMAVHEHNWQAAYTLLWAVDGKGNPPFPVLSKHKGILKGI